MTKPSIFPILDSPTRCRSNRTSRKSSLIFPIALRTKSRPKSRFRQAVKGLTIHRKTIPINNSGSPWIGRPPKSSMSRRRYPGERLNTRVGGEGNPMARPCRTGSWKLKKSGSPWQWNASSHRLGSRKSGSTSRSTNWRTTQGAITITKGSERAFRIRPSGKNGCLRSTSGGINSVTTKERYQAEKDSNG